MSLTNSDHTVTSVAYICFVLGLVLINLQISLEVLRTIACPFVPFHTLIVFSDLTLLITSDLCCAQFIASDRTNVRLFISLFQHDHLHLTQFWFRCFNDRENDMCVCWTALQKYSVCTNSPKIYGSVNKRKYTMVFLTKLLNFKIYSSNKKKPSQLTDRF